MAVWISKLERAGRYLMAALAVLALLGWAAVEQGWISPVPHYRHDAWYLVGGAAGLVITTEYADEASCRRQQTNAAACHSGRSLIQQSLSRAGERT
jgi:hypothetical protein